MLIRIEYDASKVIHESDGQIVLSFDDPLQTQLALCGVKVIKGTSLEDLQSAKSFYASKQVSLGTNGGLSLISVGDVPVITKEEERLEQKRRVLRARLNEFGEEATAPLTQKDIRQMLDLSAYDTKNMMEMECSQGRWHVVDIGPRSQAFYLPAGKGQPLVTATTSHERTYQAIVAAYNRFGHATHRDIRAITGMVRFYRNLIFLENAGRIEQVKTDPRPYTYRPVHTSQTA